MTKTPVLFAPYVRPEYARRTFDAIKKAKPEKLYFYCDKAREDRPLDIKKNNEIRAYLNEIDWNCEVKTFLREKHVGDVYASLWSAFDWVFENEERAIILEEDCVPSLQFFDFCDQLLEKYKDDERIWVISGNNFADNYNPNGYDYFYSFFPYMWGWATWRSRWKKVIRDRLPYESIKKYQLFDQIYADKKAARKAYKFTEKIIDTPSWDYRFTISMKCNGGLGVIPKTNLVSNIGIVGANNNGNQNFFHNRPLPETDRYEIKNTPPFVVADYGYSRHWFKVYYMNTTRKLIFKLKKKLFQLKTN